MRISVAMCTYNGERFLLDQLNSIASQARLPDELVICDDCSKDKTVEIIEGFRRTAPFPVRLHVNETNLGVVKNFEKAIELCAGDVIALSDQDDVWREDKLLRLERAFRENGDAGLVFSDAELVDEELKPLSLRLWQCSFDRRSQQLFSEGRAIDVLVQQNSITGATMAFLSRFRDVCLPIPTDTYLIHDGWIGLMIAAVADIAFIPEPLVRYRQHARQQIGAFGRGADSIAPRENGHSRAEALEDMAGFYETKLERYRIVRERLLAVSSADRYERNISVIDNRINELKHQVAHFRTRAAMSKSNILRAPLVVNELLTLRYHRYSNGFRSFVKDLLL